MIDSKASFLSSSTDMGGMLYIVATPIGNRSDMTHRAVEILRAADLVACEDTRTSRKLLEAYDINTPLTAYHEHNAEKERPKLLRALGEGKTIALISDAGTPLISDPGFKLVKDAKDAGFIVSPIPGACAAIAALSVAAIPSEPFTFLGFLPTKKEAQKTILAPWLNIPTSLILYEAPSRIVATLGTLAETLGEREATIARELTKQFETITKGSLHALAEEYASVDTIKGEYVIVIGPPAPQEHTLESLEDDIRAGLASGNPAKGLSEELAALSGLSKRDIYQHILHIKSNG